MNFTLYYKQSFLVFSKTLFFIRENTNKNEITRKNSKLNVQKQTNYFNNTNLEDINKLLYEISTILLFKLEISVYFS